MTPVDTYLKVTRALKYGLLFVGFADCIFYFLLLSLSERI